MGTLSVLCRIAKWSFPEKRLFHPAIFYPSKLLESQLLRRLGQRVAAIGIFW